MPRRSHYTSCRIVKDGQVGFFILDRQTAQTPSSLQSEALGRGENIQSFTAGGPEHVSNGFLLRELPIFRQKQPATVVIS